MAKLTKEENDAAFLRLTKDRRRTALSRIIVKIEDIKPKRKDVSLKDQQAHCLRFVREMNRLYGITVKEVRNACRANRLDCSFMF